MSEEVACIGADCDRVYRPADHEWKCPDCHTPAPKETLEESERASETENSTEDAVSICPSCSEPIPSSNEFCENCGTHQTEDQPPKSELPCPNDDCSAAIRPGVDYCSKCSGERETGTLSVAFQLGPETYQLLREGDLVPDGGAEGTNIQRDDDGRITVADSEFGVLARKSAVKQGGSTEKARQISREHLLFEIDGRDVYAIENGKNETVYNGTPLTDGERVRLSIGDEFKLGGSVSASVEMQ